jgi:hypothetical protein
MSDAQPSLTDPSRESDQLERDVIYLLTDRPEGQRHWSVQEVGNAMESQGNAADALHALARAGLIQRRRRLRLCHPSRNPLSGTDR